MYVELKRWARKDDPAPDCRNMYRVIKETEKAVCVIPVDYYEGCQNVSFWAPNSASKILD